MAVKLKVVGGWSYLNENEFYSNALISINSLKKCCKKKLLTENLMVGVDTPKTGYSVYWEKSLKGVAPPTVFCCFV